MSMVEYMGLKPRHVDCDRDRRLVLRAACRPRRRGDRGGQVQGRADHPGRPAARRRHGDRHGAAQPRRHADARRAVRVPLRADRGEHVRDVRDAPHARVRHDGRAARLDQGRGLAPRAVQPACAAAGRGDGRGGGELADDLRSAASARLLRHHRRRRRHRRRGARDRGQAEAPQGQADRRRRVREDPDGRQGRPHLFGRALQRRDGLRRGGRQAGRHQVRRRSTTASPSPC